MKLTQTRSTKSYIARLALSCMLLLSPIAAMANTALSCETATNADITLNKFDSMLIQVGLFHLNEEFGEYKNLSVRELANLTDGEIGPKTREAIKGFCDSISKQQKQDVVKSLFLYAALKSVEPNCQAVKNVATLNEWIGKQQDGTVKTWAQELLTRCDNERKIKGNEKANLYFMLSESNIAQLTGDDESNSEQNNPETSNTNTTETALTTNTKAQPPEPAAPAATNPNKTDNNIKEALAQLQNKAFPNKRIFEAELAKIYQYPAKDSANYSAMNETLELARKTLLISNYMLEPADCNCVGNFAYNDILYHFYPGFLGTNTAKPTLIEKALNPDEKAPIVNSIDYSIATRVAFQGLVLDQDGNFADASRLTENNTLETFNSLSQWQQQSDQFIRQAHQFHSKADLVISLENWLIWDSKSIELSLKNIKKWILTNKKETMYHWRYSSQKQLDGITLLFENFEQTDDHATKLRQIVNSYLELKKEYPYLSINLMLDIPLCTNDNSCTSMSKEALEMSFRICDISVGGQADSSDPTLQRCIVKEGLIQSSVDNILIFLPSDTSESRKYLRRLIEERYKGEARSIMMNKVIPIVGPYSFNKAGKLDSLTLEDTLIYNKHNFGGTGFWPMPLQGNANFEQASATIMKVMVEASSLSEALSNPEQANKVQLIIQQVMPSSLCKILCTQRWYFRIAFDGLLIFMLATFFFKNASCYLCKLIDKHYLLYFALWALTLTLFVAMLGCDKFWQNQADLALFLLCLLVITFFISSYIRKLKRTKDLNDIRKLDG